LAKNFCAEIAAYIAAVANYSRIKRANTALE
jgi:hypothetical protein